MHSSEASDDAESCSTGDAQALARRRLGQRLRTAREQRGIAPTKFARAVEISPSFLWRIEHGGSEPGKTLMIRIADRLGLTLDWLMLGRGPVPVLQPENATASDTSAT